MDATAPNVDVALGYLPHDGNDNAEAEERHLEEV